MFAIESDEIQKTLKSIDFENRENKDPRKDRLTEQIDFIQEDEELKTNPLVSNVKNL